MELKIKIRDTMAAENLFMLLRTSAGSLMRRQRYLYTLELLVIARDLDSPALCTSVPRVGRGSKVQKSRLEANHRA